MDRCDAGNRRHGAARRVHFPVVRPIHRAHRQTSQRGAKIRFDRYGGSTSPCVSGAGGMIKSPITKRPSPRRNRSSPSIFETPANCSIGSFTKTPRLTVRGKPTDDAVDEVRRFSMTLSSRRGVRRGGLIELVVAQHCPQDVEASTGEGQNSLGVAFSFGAFAVVVGPGRGVGAGGDVGGQITGAKQPSVVAAGAFEVAADASGVTWYRGEASDGCEAVGVAESAYVAAGGCQEFSGESNAESGHAQDDFGVAVAAKSLLDHRFGVADFGVEG